MIGYGRGGDGRWYSGDPCRTGVWRQPACASLGIGLVVVEEWKVVVLGCHGGDSLARFHFSLEKDWSGG